MIKLNTIKRYAGIGSRETPLPILYVMSNLAKYLATHKAVLRSGGAVGADRAFQKGATQVHSANEIYYANNATPESIQLASQFHPAWDKCNDYARKLHGRNSMIILGTNLDKPVDCVFCYTVDGNATGGTGLGIRIAHAHNIPVYNLYYDEIVKNINNQMINA